MNRTAALAALLAAACAAPLPSSIPHDEPFVVALKSVRIPRSYPWYTRFARHSWFDMKVGGEERWLRLEVFDTDGVVVRGSLTPERARADERWSRDVVVEKLVVGADAERIARELQAVALEYEDDGRYHAWPGPNSNTFVERVGRAVPGFRFEQDHNAVGKDYSGIVRAGGTSTGTGLELETALLGLQVGLSEGLELHVLQLTLGVALFPPALKVPFLPRLGF